MIAWIDWEGAGLQVEDTHNMDTLDTKIDTWNLLFRPKRGIGLRQSASG
jgi:hypothetical protein